MHNMSPFLDAVPAPVFWLDHNKVYRGCNQVFSDLIGLNSPIDLVGLTSKDLPYSSADLTLKDEIFDAILSGRIQVKILYDCMIGDQDKMIWIQKRFTPLKNSKGKIIGVFGTIVDISEKVNRRKDLETHVEHKQVFENFLNELNTKPFLSTTYNALIEKSIVLLQQSSQSSQVMFLNTNARSPQSFLQFSTGEIDDINLFEHRKSLLKTEDSKYLDPEAIKILKDCNQSIDSVFVYRIKQNDIITYDNVILLINPSKDKLEESTTYLSLTHHIIHCFHVNKFLAENKKSPSK